MAGRAQNKHLLFSSHRTPSRKRKESRDKKKSEGVSLKKGYQVNNCA